MFLRRASRIVRAPERMLGIVAGVAVLVVMLLWHLIPLTVLGEAPAMYYVDSISGSDSNAGTSPAAAWQTLAPLHSRTFAPGDVVSFRRGGSWFGGLHIDSSGVSGNPITFTVYGDADDPRPSFSNSGDWSSAITISGDWIVLEGVLVRDAVENGVRIEQQADHVVVRDIEATQVGVGVAVFGQDNLVTQSLFHDLTMVVETDDGIDDDWGALGVCIYNSRNEVSYNTMRGCSADSHDFGSDGGAVEIYALYGEVVGTRIHHNWSCSNSGFLEVGGLTGSMVRDTEVAYNVARNGGVFLVTHLDGTFGCSVSDLRVENNTVVEEGDGWAIMAFVGGVPTPHTLTVRNNIFDVGSFDLFTNQDGFAHSNNLINLRSPTTSLGFVPDSVAGDRLGDPLFQSAADLDFHLQEGSPAIDAGVLLGHTLDYEGNPVPDGAMPDMGAFEYVSQPVDPVGTTYAYQAFLPLLVR